MNSCFVARAPIPFDNNYKRFNQFAEKPKNIMINFYFLVLKIFMSATNKSLFSKARYIKLSCQEAHQFFKEHLFKAIYR
jgi:hypothetical protein